MKGNLLIYIIYDADGVIDAYVGFMMKNIKKIADYLLAVCNMPFIKSGKEFLECADDVYYRENLGFDFCGWRDALISFIGWEKVKNYKNIILMNDSVVGPIYEIDTIFSIMEDRYDFWGITEHQGGIFFNGQKFDRHIQSYFMVFSSKMLCDNRFVDYWERMDVSDSLEATILTKETVLTKYFENLGYRGGAFITQGMINKKQDMWNVDPANERVFENVSRFNIPFIKIKGLELSMNGFVGMLDGLEYIRDNKLYDITLLWDHVIRKCQSKTFSGEIDFYVLNKYCSITKENGGRIFIYGAGNYGRKIDRYFKYKGWIKECFLVSDDEGNDDDIVKIDSVQLAESDLIVIAIAYEHREDVINGLEERHTLSRIICVNGDIVQ